MRCSLALVFCLYFSIPICLLGTKNFSREYFQQQVNFDIKVELDVDKKYLSAQLEMNYINNSPDSLSFLYIHLWPNAYSSNNSAFAKERSIAHEFSIDDKGFIDQLEFRTDDYKLILDFDTSNFKDQVDIAKLYLPQPLAPGDSIKIYTPFRVKIPRAISRLGHENGAFQITQWFPKPAVYDRDGWHPMSYLEQGEFYSEFGNYRVQITLPDDYVVAATGQLETASEKEWLKQRVHQSTLLIDQIKDAAGLESNFGNADSLFKTYFNQVPSMDQKTIVYTAKNVHDFAWFADRNWLVEHKKINLSKTDKELDVWTMYWPESVKNWQHSIKYCQEGIEFYSKNIGTYPYNQVTTLEGGLGMGGGMEYPMINIISGHMKNKKLLERVIVHEIGHNWFQGILASNERRYPFMDEGINSFYEKRYLDEKYDRKFHTLDNKFLSRLMAMKQFNFEELIYLYQFNRNADQAIDLHSTQYSSINYGSVVYYKSAMVFNYLMHYLGKDYFDEIMQSYFLKWKFKHPSPEDLRLMFDSIDVSLDFFFDDIISSTKILDYKLKSIADSLVNKNGKLFKTLNIKNIGQISAPFYVASLSKDSILDTLWFKGFKGQMNILFPYSPQVDAYQIDAYGIMPDWNRKNNFYKTKGINRKSQGIELKPFLTFGKPRKTEIAYAPIIAYNNYDGLLLGLAFHEGLLIKKPFEMTFVPLYGTNSKDFLGIGNTVFNFKGIKQLNISRISAGINFTRFSYANNNILNFNRSLLFTKIMPFVKFKLENKKSKSTLEKLLELRLIHIDKEVLESINTQRFWSNDIANVMVLNYSHKNSRQYNPYCAIFDLESAYDYAKARVDYKRIYSYTSSGKGIAFRFFVGTFLFDQRALLGSQSLHRDIAFQMAGGTGDNDYLFNDFYIDRAIQHTNYGRIWSHHRYFRDGGFRISHQFAESDKWLSTCNIDAAIPKFKWMSFFTDLGTASNRGQFSGGESILWNAGLVLNIGLLKINLPLFYSATIKNAVTTRVYLPDQKPMTDWQIFLQNITFTMNISALKPTAIKQKLLNL